MLFLLLVIILTQSSAIQCVLLYIGQTHTIILRERRLELYFLSPGLACLPACVFMCVPACLPVCLSGMRTPGDRVVFACTPLASWLVSPSRRLRNSLTASCRYIRVASDLHTHTNQLTHTHTQVHTSAFWPLPLLGCRSYN